MSEDKKDTSPTVSSEDEMSTSSTDTSEMKVDPPTSKDFSREQSSAPEVGGTVEDYSAARVLCELNLSVHFTSDKDSDGTLMSTQPITPTKGETHDFPADETKDPQNILSPKRRHPSSQMEPEPKKPNFSKEPERDSLVSKDGDNRKESTISQPVESVAQATSRTAEENLAVGNLEPISSTSGSCMVQDDCANPSTSISFTGQHYDSAIPSTTGSHTVQGNDGEIPGTSSGITEPDTDVSIPGASGGCNVQDNDGAIQIASDGFTGKNYDIAIPSTTGSHTMQGNYGTIPGTSSGITEPDNDVSIPGASGGCNVQGNDGAIQSTSGGGMEKYKKDDKLFAVPRAVVRRRKRKTKTPMEQKFTMLTAILNTSVFNQPVNKVLLKLELENEKAKLKSERDRLRAEVSRLHAETVELEIENTKLEMAKKKLIADKEKFRTDFYNLRNKKRKLRTEKRKYNDEVKKLIANKTKLAAEKKSARAETRKWVIEKKKLRAEMEKSQSEIIPDNQRPEATASNSKPEDSESIDTNQATRESARDRKEESESDLEEESEISFDNLLPEELSIYPTSCESESESESEESQIELSPDEQLEDQFSSDSDSEQIAYMFPAIPPRHHVPPLTTDNYIPELEFLIEMYKKESKEYFGEPSIQEHVKSFQKKFINKLYEFKQGISWSIDFVHSMDKYITFCAFVINLSKYEYLCGSLEGLLRIYKTFEDENLDPVCEANMWRYVGKVLNYFYRYLMAYRDVYFDRGEEPDFIPRPRIGFKDD